MRPVTYPQLVSSRVLLTCNDAIPKSATRSVFLSSNSRFSGFKSLWLHIQQQQQCNFVYRCQRSLFQGVWLTKDRNQKHWPDRQAVAEVQGWNDLAEVVSRLLRREATFLDQIVKQFPTWYILQDEKPTHTHTYTNTHPLTHTHTHTWLMLCNVRFVSHLTGISCFRRHRRGQARVDAPQVSWWQSLFQPNTTRVNPLHTYSYLEQRIHNNYLLLICHLS